MDALRLDRRPEGLRDPVLLAAFRGWNDAASAASSALGVLAERLGATRFGILDAEEFYDFQATRPMVDLATPGEHTLSWPDPELFAAVVPAAPRDVVLLAGAEPSFRWRSFAATVLDLAEGLGVRTVVTLGALLADVPHTRPVRLTGMSSDPALIAGLGMREPSYRGPTGIVGVLHHAALERGLTAVSLWAPSSHYAAGVTNAKGALALVRAVIEVTGVPVDTANLGNAALAYERQVDRAVQGDSRLGNLVAELERAADEERAGSEPLPSGDELARELERFLREQEGEG